MRRLSRYRPRRPRGGFTHRRRTPASRTRMVRQDLNDLMTDIDPTHPNYPKEEREERQFSSSWRPPTDVIETDDEYVLHLEIPGVTRDDVHLKQHNGLLHVYGVRRGNFDETARVTCQECPQGPFSRPIPLPSNVNADETSAAFDRGVLTIHLPKTAEPKPRTIPVS